MPNKPSSRPGRSLKERLEIARQLTAEQQRAAREESAESTRTKRDSAKRETRTSSRKAESASRARSEKSTKKAKGEASKKSSSPHTRSATKEEVERAKKSRKGFNMPEIHIGLGAGIAIGIACVLIATLVLLYPVGQRYYHTVRDEQRLEAELAAAEERNQVISEQNEALKTDEGVENTARRELGWTKEGEGAAVVTNAGESNSGSSALPDQVDSKSIKAPTTWYYSILDVLFFYDNSSAADAEEQQGQQEQKDQQGQDK